MDQTFKTMILSKILWNFVLTNQNNKHIQKTALYSGLALTVHKPDLKIIAKEREFP